MTELTNNAHAKFDIQVIANKPTPVIYIQLDGIEKSVTAEFNHMLLLGDIGNLISTKIFFYKYRSVAYSRLGYVMENGIDVDPTDGVIFAESFGKAYEYGGWPKVILVLDPSQVQHTYREIPADTPEEDIRSLQAVYPTTIPSVDGSKIWLSRLPESDKRVTSVYESEYAFWIPGDPHMALVAILILCHQGDVDLNNIIQAKT